MRKLRTIFFLIVVVALVPATAVARPASRTAPTYEPGQVVVRYAHAARTLQRAAARAHIAAVHLADSSLKDTEVLAVAGDPVAEAARIAQMPGVAWAEPNYRYHIETTPTDTLYPSLWGMSKIGAPAAWDTSTGSANVVVGVVDTGLTTAHQDLASNLWRNTGETGTDGAGADRATNGIDDDGNGKIDDWQGWNFQAHTNNVADIDATHRHGTHVSGTIGARGNDAYGVAGVNWSVSLMPLPVFDAIGNAYSNDIAAAFTYAGRMGAKVVNASLGGAGYSNAMADAIAGAPNTLFVVAAGNDSSDTATSNTYPCNYTYANLICVEATDQSDTLASWSNHSATSVDLAAPGVGIWSTSDAGTWRSLSGTSMATPHVTGSAALLAAAHPSWTVADLRAALLGTVDAIPGLAGTSVTGGRLNLARAMAWSAPSSPPPPAPSSGGGGAPAPSPSPSPSPAPSPSSSPSPAPSPEPSTTPPPSSGQTPIPSLTLSAPATVHYPDRIALRGRITLDGAAMRYKPLRIEASSYGSTIFRALTTLKSSYTGDFGVWTDPSARTVYRAVFDGDGVASSATSTARAVTVTVRTLLGSSASSAPRGTTLRLSGSVAPTHPGHVRIEQWNGSAWVLLLHPALDSQGRFAVAWRPARAGLYKLRAVYVTSDKDHLSGACAPINMRIS